MAKVHSFSDQSGVHAGWMILCPACGNGHLFDSRWTFNGDKDKPTFRASMLVYEEDTNPAPRLPGYKRQARCHSFVTDGKIEFLPDCTHEMKGKTVELEDW